MYFQDYGNIEQSSFFIIIIIILLGCGIVSVYGVAKYLFFILRNGCTYLSN